MNIIPIRSEADHKLALKRMEEIFDAPIGTIQSDEADIL
jgi:HTH-type transcriptional regulator / antitoxin HigA